MSSLLLKNYVLKFSYPSSTIPTCNYFTSPLLEISFQIGPIFFIFRDIIYFSLRMIYILINLLEISNYLITIYLEV